MDLSKIFEACLEVSAPAVEIKCLSLLKIPISVSFGQQFQMRQFTSGSKCRFFLQIQVRLCDDETEV